MKRVGVVKGDLAFVLPFIAFAFFVIGNAAVHLVRSPPESWTLVLAVIASVIICGPFHVGIGYDRGFPQAGVSIVILAIQPMNGATFAGVGVWAVGVLVAQIILKRSVWRGLYATGLASVGGVAFVATRAGLESLGVWLIPSLFVATAAYYAVMLLGEFARQWGRAEVDRGVSAASVKPSRVVLLVFLVGTAMSLMHFIDATVIGWLEGDPAVRRSSFIVLLTGSVFYVLAQRTRSEDIEERLNAVVDAAIELPREHAEALGLALQRRTREIVRANEVELRPSGPGPDEIGAPVRLESGPEQYLVASRKLGGGPFSRDDERAIESLAHLATEAARVQSEVDTLEHRANSDPLTGLPNYGAFQHALTEANEHRPYHEGIALLFIDLDNFKKLNDNLGHSAGDALLQAIASRLERASGGGDFVSRVGGDEFVVIFTGLVSVDQAKESADRVIDAVSEALELEGHNLHPVVSAGLAFSSHREIDAQSLVEDADRTMLQAKQQRRRGSDVERSTVSISTHRSTRLNEIVARAIADNRLMLAFQPIVDMSTGKVWAFEALTRYMDPELGPISAPSLIARAKRLGLMNELTRQVITKALDAAEEFRDVVPSIDCMTVNLELGQISDVQLGPYIREAARNHPNIKLCIELNERSLRTMSDELRRDAELLQAAGVIIALDDYGSDDSLVGALVHFPMDILKIDKSLISNLGDVRQQEVIKALQGFGDNLGHTVIVEGIEDRAAAETLQALGVRDAQGYFYGRPIAAPLVMDRLRKHGDAADITTA
ncbi:putative bifunctional diguanylate cyclase/phosphodiesterase [Leucobacter sp. NPDC058333]|uniref:putative bifunctional diguanylate cyclase/phosphodiesterase n=1 Tax=Leucobacter sp. NPDC058333 TaxID=3346450 RepID=UPI003665F8E4